MKLVILFGFLVFLVGGYAFASKQPWFPGNAPKVEVPTISLQGNPQDQLGILASRAQELGGLAQGFISAGIQKDTSDPSLSQQAMNYGQYLYCKQVVSSYEAQANSEAGN